MKRSIVALLLVAFARSVGQGTGAFNIGSFDASNFHADGDFLDYPRK
jgi:hypothetical protein